MTKTRNPQQIDRLFQVSLTEKTVADSWQRNDVVNRLVSAMRRHDYFRVIDFSHGVKNDPMFEIVAEYPAPRRQAEWVQRDVGEAWERANQKALESCSGFRKTNEGFEVCLFAMYQKYVIFGRLNVRQVQFPLATHVAVKKI